MDLQLDVDPIVHSLANALLAAEITLGCSDRRVTEQKLDLLQIEP
jgi:hypothetical protein